MKNHRLKNYFKIGIFLIGILFITTSCYKENYTIDRKLSENNKIGLKQYKFKDLSANPVFMETFKKLNAKNSKTKLSSKTALDSLYNFSIDSTRIKEVKINNKTSYTIFIKRPFETPDYFENLVIQSDSSKFTNAFIIKYTPISKTELFDEHHSFSFEGNRTIYPLDLNKLNLANKSASDVCWDEVEIWCHYSYDHVAGPTCKDLFTKYIEVCQDVYGNNYTNSSGGGGGSNMNGDLSSSSTILTSPVDSNGNPVDFPDYISQINSQFSILSPYDVDVTQILDSIALPKNDSLKLANQKFLCLYNKLITSKTYNNLFTNIFGGKQEVLNVSFKVTKDLRSSNGKKDNGKRTVLPGSKRVNGVITKLNILIEIDQDLLKGNSNYNAIKTIIHESIHAFLTLKKLTCNSQVALDNYNNEDVSETINTMYNSFCTANQSQHDFMFNHMLPVFKSVFEEIGKLNFTSQASIDGLITYDLKILNQLIETDIANSHSFNWDEFYFYNSLPGLHNTTFFQSDIKNNSEKYELYKAYKWIGKNKLSKECN
jgi:hypothetical protein